LKVLRPPFLCPTDESGNRISDQGLAVQSKNTYINARHCPLIALGTSSATRHWIFIPAARFWLQVAKRGTSC